MSLSAGGGAPCIQPSLTGSESAALSGAGGACAGTAVATMSATAASTRAKGAIQESPARRARAGAAGLAGDARVRGQDSPPRLRLILQPVAAESIVPRSATQVGVRAVEPVLAQRREDVHRLDLADHQHLVRQMAGYDQRLARSDVHDVGAIVAEEESQRA